MANNAEKIATIKRLIVEQYKEEVVITEEEFTRI